MILVAAGAPRWASMRQGRAVRHSPRSLVWRKHKDAAAKRELENEKNRQAMIKSRLYRALKADERLRSIVATCPAPRISPAAAASTLASHPDALASPSRRGIEAWA